MISIKNSSRLWILLPIPSRRALQKRYSPDEKKSSPKFSVSGTQYKIIYNVQFSEMGKNHDLGEPWNLCFREVRVRKRPNYRFVTKWLQLVDLGVKPRPACASFGLVVRHIGGAALAAVLVGRGHHGSGRLRDIKGLFRHGGGNRRGVGDVGRRSDVTLEDAVRDLVVCLCYGRLLKLTSSKRKFLRTP